MEASNFIAAGIFLRAFRAQRAADFRLDGARHSRNKIAANGGVFAKHRERENDDTRAIIVIVEIQQCLTARVPKKSERVGTLLLRRKDISIQLSRVRRGRENFVYGNN